MGERADRVRGRRTKILVGALAAVVVVGAVVVLAIGVPGNSSAAQPSATPAAQTSTVKVARGDLANVTTKTGTAGFGTKTDLTGKAPGTITQLPAVGAVIPRGKVIYRADEKPVILFTGKLPLFRPVSVDDKGRDVELVKANLKALGYRFTASSITAWQKANGLPQTGIVDPASIVVASGPIRVDSVSARLGDNATGNVLTYTGLQPSISVDRASSDRFTAKQGDAVTVTLADGTTRDGKVASVTNTVDTSGEGGPQNKTTYLVVTTGPKIPAGVTTAKVAFSSDLHKDVLYVPVTALVALLEGGYAVEKVTDGTSELVGVTLDLVSDGKAEISGAGIGEGDTVVVPS